MRNQYTSTFEQDYPCRAQIIRCKADRDAAPMNDYRYPEESGSFTGTLTFRCWHRSKPMLLCFFDADDGRKIKLSVWWQSWGVNYSPSKTLINFADEVFDGSRWHCTYRKKSNGYAGRGRSSWTDQIIKQERPGRDHPPALGALPCSDLVRLPFPTPDESRR